MASTALPSRPPETFAAALRRGLVVGSVSLLTLLLAAPVLGTSARAAPAVERPAPVVPPMPGTRDEHMVVEADQAVYDDHADTVTALGNVHIYYKSTTLIAHKVTYLRATRKVIAEGDVRLIDKDGNVLTAPRLDASDGFAEGFVESLRIDSVDRSRFAAESAKRSDGNVTVFEKGVYSACQTCVNEPEKPPFWQIKAARIIHKQDEKTVYYEDAKLEMLGVPIAYVPYFQHPDPTEKRKTGFLMPRVIFSNKTGAGVQQPFYWAPVADWDATLQPTLMSRQGLLADAEVRHRFESGLVTVRGFGIDQMDRKAYVDTSGDRKVRGGVSTTGRFTINEKWSWGWEATAISDRHFLSDYKLTQSGVDHSLMSTYLTGQGLRNSFDARLYKFTVLNDDFGYDANGNKLLWGAGTELQDKQPVVHPVIDYDFVSENPVAGGEVSGRFNFTSLSRSRSDIDTIGRVYGLAGTFSRVSGIAAWRRQFIDGFGQVITPFASLRGDLLYEKVTDPSLGYLGKDGTFGRVMPTIGVDYRYPFIATTAQGSHIFEPIAQFVVRPSETWAGRLANDDAQSLVFDDTTLFRADKFSGWDRTEGGSRLNVGANYTFQSPDGSTMSMLMGRSYLVSGVNSFGFPSYSALLRDAAMGRAVPLTAFGSGLETSASDWVGRVTLDSNAGFRIGAQGRFDSATFDLARADIQAVGTSGPLSASVGWSYLKTPKAVYDLLAVSPLAGAAAVRAAIKDERSELQSALNLRVAPAWRLFGAIRYDLKDRYVSGDNVGIGYDNDSFSISLAYNESTYQTVTSSTISTVHDQTYYLRFGFRTLGDGQMRNSLR
ncbi:LPS-assembly protein LptD [Siculibacillus lacustris]|uniref:LPS-assembly protein LptD n=1 Tax=Siculibacillus lacustris TaxID=1549641 RepID=UPI0013F15099|nr:LPS-assembly protein LptD [Siculibacillus lacustris]